MRSENVYLSLAISVPLLICGTTLANYITSNNELIITSSAEWTSLLFSGQLQWRMEYCPCVGGLHNHAYLKYGYLTAIDNPGGGWTLTIIPAGTRVAYVPAGGSGDDCGGGGQGGAGEPEPIPVSEPPVASFTFSPEAPLAREAVKFDASDSNDHDGMIESFLWDFGDRNWGEGQVVNHTYNQSGLYPVSLTVTDDSGSADTTRLTIEVVSPLHVLCVGMDYGWKLNGREDAQAIYKKLKKFPNWASTNPGPLVLSPTAPNMGTLLQAFLSIRSNLHSGDDFIFYFSGHGVFPWSPNDSPQVQRSGDETPIWLSTIWLMNHGVPIPDPTKQFLPPDMRYYYFFNTQDEYLKIHDGGGWENNLRDDILTSWLNDPTWAAVNKFVFIDACHSGGFWGDHNSGDYGDLEKLPSCALMAAASEARDTGSDPVTGRGLWTMALEEAIVFAKTPSEIAKYIMSWGGTTMYLNRTLPLREDDPSPEGATMTFESSLWEPVFYATEDFNLCIPKSTFFEHTLTIENVVGQLQTDPNSPHLNQGRLTYTEGTGNLEGIDPNDVAYASPEATSSKIVSLVPRSNVRRQTIGYDELSKDARPLPSSPDNRNDDGMFQLSIYAPETNQQSLSSENRLEFSLANNAFRGRPLTVQQVSSDPSITYPVWDVNEIVSQKGGILPLSDLSR